MKNTVLLTGWLLALLQLLQKVHSTDIFPDFKETLHKIQIHILKHGKQHLSDFSYT
jgi:hypothetical protein